MFPSTKSVKEFASLEDIKELTKAGERKTNNKCRVKLTSVIATDIPEKNKISYKKFKERFSKC